MFVEDENLVLDNTENVEEQTTEEIVEDEKVESEVDENSSEEPIDEQPKIYSQEDFDKKIDEILAKKIARQSDKVRKEYQKKYGRLENVLKAGTGEDDINKITDSFSEFYSKKGITIPDESIYNQYDMEAGAEKEANVIISSGMEEVKEETDRLARIGADNMTPREKLIFNQLAEYRKQNERKNELKSIGVKEEVIESEEFKDFASQFNSNTPIKKVYELYTKTSGKPNPTPAGSMKNGNTQEEKTFYTPEEVDLLTAKDFDNPIIYNRVRESMAKWK